MISSVRSPHEKSPRGRVLLVDDDVIFRRALAATLSHAGFYVRAYASGTEALAGITTETPGFEVALIDLRMPAMDGMSVLREAHRMDPSLHIIMLTAYGDVPAAVEAVKAGAEDFLLKPMETALLVTKLTRICNVRRAMRKASKGTQIIHQSAVMRQLLADARRVATARSTILIVGETGSGKDLLAHYIHRHSRRKGPFVGVNVAAIPRDLVAAELFGNTKGAFTGAVSERKGLFVAAHGGTLFLDEVGDMPMEQQPHLLRALQERLVRPVGGTEERPVDVRVIAATSKDPDTLVSSKQIRQDLFYRLSVVILRIPPLRERKEDISALAESFLESVRQQGVAAAETISTELLNILGKHDWPGNVRELQNVILRMAIASPSRELTPRDLPADFSASSMPAIRPLIDLKRLADLEGCITLPEILDRVERESVMWAMTVSGGNHSRASKLLRIPRTTLNAKITKWSK